LWPDFQRILQELKVQRSQTEEFEYRKALATFDHQADFLSISNQQLT